MALPTKAVEPSDTSSPPLPPRLPSTPKGHAFTFHGDAAEYFRIWIVNTLFTLASGGLLSAWAKVRKRRYFRGNTELLGHRFDYRADPWKIFLGNLVVVALFLGYAVIGGVYLKVRVAALLAGVVLLPWVIGRSLAFNAHNTCYRGMRFHFRHTYGMTALIFLGLGTFVVLTLGLYYPAWMRHRREYLISQHRLGDAFFKFTGGSGPFYSAYLRAGLLILATIVVGSLLMVLMMTRARHSVPTLLDQVPFWICYGLVLYFARQYLYAKIFNHVWNHTQLDEHRFVARLNTRHWLRLQLENLGALLVSFGFLYPWAVIRSTRYALGCLEFLPQRPVEHIGRLGRHQGSALGDAAGEFVGLDFGL